MNGMSGVSWTLALTSRRLWKISGLRSWSDNLASRHRWRHGRTESQVAPSLLRTICLTLGFWSLTQRTTRLPADTPSWHHSGSNQRWKRWQDCGDEADFANTTSAISLQHNARPSLAVDFTTKLSATLQQVPWRAWRHGWWWWVTRCCKGKTSLTRSLERSSTRAIWSFNNSFALLYQINYFLSRKIYNECFLFKYLKYEKTIGIHLNSIDTF